LVKGHQNTSTLLRIEKPMRFTNLLTGGESPQGGEGGLVYRKKGEEKVGGEIGKSQKSLNARDLNFGGQLLWRSRKKTRTAGKKKTSEKEKGGRQKKTPYWGGKAMRRKRMAQKITAGLKPPKRNTWEGK